MLTRIDVALEHDQSRLEGIDRLFPVLGALALVAACISDAEVVLRLRTFLRIGFGREHR